MKIDTASTKGWRLRDAPFPHQETYVTPLKDLTKFVATILSPFAVQAASIWIEQIIFTAHDLIAYLHAVGIEAEEGLLNHSKIYAESSSEASALLEHVLGDWIDFAFIPSSPKNFAIYADHDEYTTVFTATADLLNSLREHMKASGFQEATNWSWTGPHSPGLKEET